MSASLSPQLALIDQAFEAEIVRVSTLEYNSNEICRHFYAELRKRIEANYLTQSRPEAELPEVTDEMVERACRAICAKHGHDPDERTRYAGSNKLVRLQTGEFYPQWKMHEPEVRIALQAAYGQQCAASRPADVDPSMEPFCVDDVRATAGEGDRSDD